MYVDIRDRAALFSAFVGSEVKGLIASRHRTAESIATELGHSISAFNGWLNGKREMPLHVMCKVCELLGEEPDSVVERAYTRLINEAGAYVSNDATSDVSGDRKTANVTHIGSRRGTGVETERDRYAADNPDEDFPFDEL